MAKYSNSTENHGLTPMRLAHPLGNSPAKGRLWTGESKCLPSGTLTHWCTTHGHTCTRIFEDVRMPSTCVVLGRAP